VPACRRRWRASCSAWTAPRRRPSRPRRRRPNSRCWWSATAAERRAPTPTEGGAAAEADAEGWAVQIGATQEWLAVSRRQLTQVRDLLASDGV